MRRNPSDVKLGSTASLLRRMGAMFYDALLLLAILFFSTLAILPLNKGNAIASHDPDPDSSVDERAGDDWRLVLDADEVGGNSGSGFIYDATMITLGGTDSATLVTSADLQAYDFTGGSTENSTLAAVTIGREDEL